MKKVISLCLALCLIFAIGVFQVSAADGATLVMKADKSNIKSGDLVKFTVSVEGIEKLTGLGEHYQLSGFQFDLDYDSDFFELALGEPNALGVRRPIIASVKSDKLLGSWEPEIKEMTAEDDSKFIRVIADDSKREGMIGNADLLTFTLKVKEGAKVVEDATTQISFIEIGDICDIDSVKVTDQFALSDAIEFTVAEEAPVSSAPSEDPSKDPSEDPSKDPSKTSSDDKSPATGDAGLLAVGALLAVAAGAAFVTMKKSK